MSTGQASPFLRWAGSKRQLLPVLSQYWKPTYIRYVEPFAGSACLFYRLQPQQAILGDINSELMATYRAVRDNVLMVIEAVQKLEKSKEEYLRLRSVDLTPLDPPTRAARFIYLNRFCFNGLYRTNQSGKFNVPYSGDRTGALPSRDALLACSKSLENVALVDIDFATVLKYVRPGDFVYMDPPFAVSARRVFNEYDRSRFADKDIKLLRTWMDILHAKGIPFLVSYAESDEADYLRKGFRTEAVEVRRNIAGFAGSRVRTKEVLISNVR